MKFCHEDPEICRGQVHGPRKERKRIIIIIILKKKKIIIIIIIRNGTKTVVWET